MNRIFRRAPAEIDEALARLSDAQKLEYYMLVSKYLAAKKAVLGLRQMRDQQDPATRAANVNRIKKMMIRLQEEESRTLKAKTDFEDQYMASLGIGAFSLTGAVSGVSTTLTAVKAIATAAQTFVSVAEPVLGIALPKDDKAAFTRTEENTDPATIAGPAFSNVPSGYAEALFTTEALSYITMEETSDDENDIKALRDISLIHFFTKTENDVLSARMLSAPSGSIVCSVQSKDDVSEIIKGSEEAIHEITLWKDGSTIPWYLVDHTFKSCADANAVRTATKTAAAAWNKVAPGGIKFVYAGSAEEAAFTVEYKGPAGAREATGFFPAEYNRGYSDLAIHTAALAEGNRGNLGYTVLHQLGHILGFRHHYIVNQERDREMGNTDVQPNPIAVMALQYPNRINFSDIVTTRKIYDTFSGEGIHILGKSENGKMIRVKVKRIKTGVSDGCTGKGTNNNNKQCQCCRYNQPAAMRSGDMRAYSSYSVI